MRNLQVQDRSAQKLLIAQTPWAGLIPLHRPAHFHTSSTHQTQNFRKDQCTKMDGYIFVKTERNFFKKCPYLCEAHKRGTPGPRDLYIERGGEDSEEQTRRQSTPRPIQSSPTFLPYNSPNPFSARSLSLHSVSCRSVMEFFFFFSFYAYHLLHFPVFFFLYC